MRQPVISIVFHDSTGDTLILARIIGDHLTALGAGEGIEFFLLVLAISISLFITGGGRYSADRLMLQFIDGNGNHPFLKRS